MGIQRSPSIESQIDWYGETKKFTAVRIATMDTRKEKPPYTKGLTLGIVRFLCMLMSHGREKTQSPAE